MGEHSEKKPESQEKPSSMVVVKLPRPEGRGFCLAAALRAREVRERAHQNCLTKRQPDPVGQQKEYILVK
jgi:hypothetical protein